MLQRQTENVPDPSQAGGSPLSSHLPLGMEVWERSKASERTLPPLVKSEEDAQKCLLCDAVVYTTTPPALSFSNTAHLTSHSPQSIA